MSRAITPPPDLLPGATSHDQATNIPHDEDRSTISADSFHALVSGRKRGFWHGLLRGGLWTASIPYAWATSLRNQCYDHGIFATGRAPVPVVSIGNLTLGGTGKTPCVEYVARFFRRRGRRVAILSRGYGGLCGRNDEAMLLEENLPRVPHLQGADRAALAREAVVKFHSQVLLLDDGFQHRRLARDLDVVLIDATQPWGYDHLFPRGLLREAPEGLKRSGIIVLTRCDQSDADERRKLRETIARLAPRVPVVETRHRPLELVNSARRTAPTQRLKVRPVAAFCGIGNPEAFRRTLENEGAAIRAFRNFPDHHAYTQADEESLRTWASQQAPDAIVVTTQKDLVKLRWPELGGREVWALKIGLHFKEGKEMFDWKLERLFGNLASKRAS